jgi:hypothetical protein
MLHFDTFGPSGEAGRYQPDLPRRKCRGAFTRLVISFLLSEKYRLLRRALLRLKPSRIY